MTTNGKTPPRVFHLVPFPKEFLKVQMTAVELDIEFPSGQFPVVDSHPEFDPYRVDRDWASVCSSLEKVTEIERRLDTVFPAGPEKEWKLYKGTWACGSPNPSPCDAQPETHKHYLLSCFKGEE